MYCLFGIFTPTLKPIHSCHSFDEALVKCKRLELESQLPISQVFSHLPLGILEITKGYNCA